MYIDFVAGRAARQGFSCNGFHPDIFRDGAEGLGLQVLEARAALLQAPERSEGVM
jgi:hypothetical protein